MTATVVGTQGRLIGMEFSVGGEPVTFGRGEENDIVLTTAPASRLHAELRPEASGYVLYDRGSTNGTRVNGVPVTVRSLEPGDLIAIGDEIFRFDGSDSTATTRAVRAPAASSSAAKASSGAMQVTTPGGGPAGRSFALLLGY